MATVPNYYYNSPWIADAGRNLASALAPPDPDKELAREYTRFQYDQAKKNATIADTKRENSKLIEDYHAEMIRPVVNPLTGQIDQKLTNDKILKNWADAIDLGADPSIGAALSGELNPDVAVKRMIAQLKAGQALGLANLNWDRRGVLQDDAQSATSDEAAKQRAWQSEQNALRLKNYLDGIKLRGDTITGKGGPNEIPVPIIKEIAFGLDDFIAATGRDMPLEKYNRLAENVAKSWQINGNVQQALNESWAKAFPNSRTYAGAEADPDEPGFFSNTRGMLNPTFDNEPAAYSDALVPGADAAAAAAAVAGPAEEPAAPPPARPPAKPKAAGTVTKKPTKPLSSYGR